MERSQAKESRTVPVRTGSARPGSVDRAGALAIATPRDWSNDSHALQSAPMLAARGQFPATVKENLSICREHWRLTLALPSFPATEPGQFVQVLCRDPSDQQNDEFEKSPRAMLRRPFSLAGRRD